jgi:hypothetical protein
MHDENSPPIAKKTNRKRWLLFGAMAVISFSLGILGAQLLGKPSITVPENITQKADFPIYLPRRLPGNFQIVKNSFSFEEDTLLFTAKDGAGAVITFAEQKRDHKFDFTAFHNAQMTEAKTLNGTPFASVAGKAKVGQANLLSVVTDDTWIFASTLAPLDEEAMRTIAANLKQ